MLRFIIKTSLIPNNDLTLNAAFTFSALT